MSDPPPQPGGTRAGLRSPTVLLLVVLALAAVVRLSWIDADPPIDFGAAHLTDEGYYLKNGKEWLLRGQLTHVDDNHDHVHLAPLTVAGFTAGMLVGGPSLGAARVVSAGAGLALIGIAWWGLRRRRGVVFAIAAAGLMAIDPALVYLGRVALAEGLLLPVSLLFVLCVAQALEGRGRWWPSWVVFAAAMLVKASALPLIGVAVVAIVLEATRRRAWGWGLQALLRFGSGAAVVLGLWRFLYIPSSAGARFMYDYEFSAHVGVDAVRPLTVLIRSLTTQHAAFAFIDHPLLAGVAAVAVVVCVVACVRGQGASSLTIAASAWLLTIGTFHSAMPYQPPRYFLVLAAPAALLAAEILAAPAEYWKRARAALGSPGPVAGIVCWMATAIALRSAGLSAPSAVVVAGAAASLAVAAVATDRRRVLAALLVIAPVATLWRWAHTRTNSVREIAATVTARLGPEDGIVGYFADTFTVGSPARSYVVHGPWNPVPVDRLGIRYALIREDELRWLTDREPDLAARLEAVESYAPQAGVRGSLTLYEVRPASPVRSNP